jgi:bacterioferritin
MQPAHPSLVETLNEVLTAELTAINQYFLHAKMQADWGYKRLAAHSRHESIDEMHHAEQVTERILLFDGVPNYVRYYALRIGETVPEQFEMDLALEYEAVERLNRGIALAVEHGDNGTRDLLERILVDEEEHIDWIETQQETIRQVGAENYLAQQMHADDD